MPRLMDYSLPTAAKVPAIEVLKPESPSPFALGAFKGFESAARSMLRSPWWAR
jgi:CO/xanthine dehydrogenase Mo-binding subunit